MPSATNKQNAPVAVWHKPGSLACSFEPELSSECGTKLFSVSKVYDYDNEAVRKLINESVGIFMNLQRQSATRTLGSEEMVLISEKYRSLIRCCCLNLQENLQDDLANEQLLNLYQAVELIWSLCEVVFINPSGELACYELKRWGRWHFTKGDDWLKEIQEENPPVLETHFRYWDTVFVFILFGRLEEARSLLSSHSKKLDPAFLSLDELIRKNPLSTRSLDLNNDVWSAWQHECRRRCSEGYFTAYPELQLIARLFAGDETVYDELLSFFDTWYEMLVSRTWHMYPTSKITDLQSLIQECVSMFPDSEIGEIDKILVDVFEFDVLKLLKDVSSCFNNWWFAGHLADLFFHCHCEEVQRVVFSQSLRDFLLLDYATSLMDHHSLWEVGILYLDCCSQFGSKSLELYLEKMPLGTEQNALRLVDICAKRGFGHLTQTICRTKTVNALKQNHLSDAMSWCLQSKDPLLSGFVAEHLLIQFGTSRILHSMHLLDNLGEFKLLSPSLAFLGKYKEFHSLCAAKQSAAASQLALTLLASNVAPKKFWPVLLRDIQQFVNVEVDGKMLLGAADIYKLMEIVEVIVNETELLQLGTYLVEGQTADDLLLDLRQYQLGLVNNLSKSSRRPK